MLIEQYISEWLNLRLSGLRIFLRNQLLTAISILTRAYQLNTIIGVAYIDTEVLPSYNYLPKESHILHDMLTQMIITHIGQRNEMTYMELWMITCILLS